MVKIWNISTTMRNPERLFNFLRVLKDEIEGLEFNEETQALYQKKLVQYKLYKPLGLGDDLKFAYEEPGNFTDEETEEVFNLVKNPDQRGRTSASRLNQMGLAIAKKSKGEVLITDLGNNLLNEKISVDDFFLKYFLKWQLPNPLESGYDDFDIAPFISTLYIINEVNNLEIKRDKKPKGISRDEFMLFCLQLKKSLEIPKVIDEIIEYRDVLNLVSDKNKFFNGTLNNKILQIYGLTNEDKDFNKKAGNMKDYSDSIIRWFRMTGLIYYRGGRRYIDIAPSKFEEVKKLLEVIPLNSNKCSDEDEYRNYLVDFNRPILPWENIESLKNIINNLFQLIREVQIKIDKEYPGKRKHQYETDSILRIDNFEELKSIEKSVRSNLDSINNEYMTLKENDALNLEEYSEKLIELSQLKRSSRNSSKAPLCLEWYTSLSLMAIDDAIEIKPNFLRGDDGLPIYHAPGGGPDIECFYKSFNLVVEVTLMKGRDQVNGELQPLLRHYKDFTTKNTKYLPKKSFVLFIAPFFHRDFLNFLQFYIDKGYEEMNVNLVLLSIEQFSKLLITIKDNHDNNIVCSHTDLEKLFNECVNVTKYEQTTVWVGKIDEILDNWKNSFY